MPPLQVKQDLYHFMTQQHNDITVTAAVFDSGVTIKGLSLFNRPCKALQRPAHHHAIVLNATCLYARTLLDVLHVLILISFTLD